MKYTKVTFRLNNDEDFVADIAIAALGEIGFDSFEETTQGFAAYCPTTSFDEATMNAALAALPITLEYQYRIEAMPDCNWNATWEQNAFEPIEIDNRCIIFSTLNPTKKSCEYPIKINPEMAFGSGNHCTTRLIIKKLLDFSLQNKQTLDMGCGTGILSICAAMRGAKTVVAVDVDEWSTRNASSNCALNGIDSVDIRLGSIEIVDNLKFDVILANINRNILLTHLPHYAQMLHTNGTLMLSGFYETDAHMLIDAAEKQGLHLVEKQTDCDWCMLVFEK